MSRLLAFQNQIPAGPAGEPRAGTPAPAPATNTSTGAPAPAASSSGSAPPSLMSGLFPLLLVVPLILIMFWSSRSQQKKQAAAVEALQKGDRVLLQSGIVGKLLEKGDRLYKVEIAPGVKVDILKSSVLGKDGAEAAAQLEKK